MIVFYIDHLMLHDKWLNIMALLYYCIIFTGLRLTLNIEYDQYIGMFSHKVGARIAVHPNNITAFPEDFGVNAGPGQNTEIGVNMVYTKE